MFEPNTLRKIAEEVIGKDEERAHLEETGAELVHYDFELTKIDSAVLASGRTGDFYKFTFEYRLTVLDEQGLLSPEDDVRLFRRSVRLDLQGKVVAIGERMEL